MHQADKLDKEKEELMHDLPILIEELKQQQLRKKLIRRQRER